LDFSEDALMVLALQADGSMRDAQGMLERVAAAGTGRIDVDTVEKVLGLVGRLTLHDILAALINRDAPTLLTLIDKVYRYGYDMAQLYRTLMEQFRNLMVLKAGYEDISIPLEEKQYLKDLATSSSLEEIHRALSVLIRSEEDFKYSSLPKITLETILLRIISAPNLMDIQQLIQSLTSKPLPYQPALKPVERALDMYKRPPSTISRSWDGFLSYLKDHDQPLFAIISKTSLEKDDERKITLAAPSTFLAEQVTKGKKELEKKASAFLQREITIHIEVREDASQSNSLKPSELRAMVLNSPIVKELVTEFNGMVKDVKSKE
jgi:DNA polymerase-3 subunit gamma/tau